jgi:hypothetical protein
MQALTFYVMIDALLLPAVAYLARSRQLSGDDLSCFLPYGIDVGSP